MKHNLLFSANGLCTPPCGSSHGKSLSFQFRNSLLLLFLLIVGNGQVWASTNYFTPGKTLYFHVDGDCKNWGGNQFAALFYYQNNENKAYGYENENYSARQFVGNNSIGSSNRIKCTKINDYYYSVVIPSNGTANIGYVRLIHLNTDDGWCHQAQKKVSADSFTSTNNCLAYSAWDDGDPSGFEAYNSGECVTNACGGGGDPEPEPLSGDYYVYGAGGTNWVSGWSKPVEDYKMTISDGVASKTFYNVKGNGLNFKVWNKTTSSDIDWSKYSSSKSENITCSNCSSNNICFDLGSNVYDITVYTNGTEVWVKAKQHQIPGSAWRVTGTFNGWSQDNEQMSNDATNGCKTVTISNINKAYDKNGHGWIKFKLFEGTAWDTNVNADNSTVIGLDGTVIGTVADDNESADGRIIVQVDETSDITFSYYQYAGGANIVTVKRTTATPAATYTVTLHPNNGGSKIVRENVPEGSTTSAAALNLAEVTYGLGTATWYTNPECTTPFSTVTSDMNLYAKWGVSGNYYVVGDLWMYDAGSSWDNNKGQLMTNTNGVSSVTYTAPNGLNRFEIIKDKNWGKKINGGNYSAVINASSPIPLSVSDGHIVFTLTEAKQVTITFDGKVSVSATDYSFNQAVDWRVKTSDSGWGNVPNAWDHSNVMTKNASGASIDIFNVPGNTNHSFMITRGSDEQAVVGTYNFNALWLDTSAPSSGLTWNMQNTNIGDRQLAQTDNLWRNCSFSLSAESDLRITFDGGKIRCDILPRISTIELNESSHDALIGADFMLNYILTPSDAAIKSVEWKSDNTSVATVDNNGNVHAAGVGTATITCTITDLHDVPHPATCTVNVTELSLMQLINATLEGNTLTLTHDYNDNAVINKAITINGQGHTIGDLTVQTAGDLTLSSGLKVQDFTICAKAGNTTNPAASGQVHDAANLTVSGNAYFLYTVDPNGRVQYGWYDFTVPFPVNAASGIKGIQEGVLKENFAYGPDYAIMDYDGAKQAQGQYPYKKFRGVMQPNQLYSITLDDDYNYNTLRMQKTAEGTLVDVHRDNVTLNAYPGDGIHENWNGVGNGTLHHADAGISGTYIQVYQSGDKTFLPVDKNQYSFVVGTAFMVQQSGTMTLNQATHNRLLAPARQASAPATAIQIAREGQPFLSQGNDYFSDQLFITASETGGQAYTQGTDLAKAGNIGNVNVPQIWTNAYNTPLCVHEAQLINGEASYNLSIYAPVAGAYTLTSRNIPADYSLYLTQNGMMLTELNGTYTLDLNKGITTEYGLLLVETYKTPTGIEDSGIKSQESGIRKILRNGVLYILHNGKIYNAQGGKMK